MLLCPSAARAATAQGFCAPVASRRPVAAVRAGLPVLQADSSAFAPAALLHFSINPLPCWAPASGTQ